MSSLPKRRKLCCIYGTAALQDLANASLQRAAGMASTNEKPRVRMPRLAQTQPLDSRAQVLRMRSLLIDAIAFNLGGKAGEFEPGLTGPLGCHY